MKRVFMAMAFLMTFAAQAEDGKTTVLRTLSCQTEIQKVDKDQKPIAGTEQKLKFTIRDSRTEYTEPFEFTGYSSILTMPDPTSKTRKLYGDFSNDGGNTDYEEFRDGKPDDSWAGLAWYSLTPNKNHLGDEEKEIARLFLRSVEEQRGKTTRSYLLAVSYHDLKNEDRPMKFGYRSLKPVVCQVKK